MKMIIKNLCVLGILCYHINISLCQEKYNCYLHFRDKPSDRFYCSESTFFASIDSCFCSNDTLFVVLKSPIKKVLKNSGELQIRDVNLDSAGYYYSHYCRSKKSGGYKGRYIECFSLPDCYSRQSISYVIIKNYYCNRYFKHKRKNHYFQVASEIFSDHKEF